MDNEEAGEKDDHHDSHVSFCISCGNCRRESSDKIASERSSKIGDAKNLASPPFIIAHLIDKGPISDIVDREDTFSTSIEDKDGDDIAPSCSA